MPSSQRMIRMMAIVSSIGSLLWRAARPPGLAAEPDSNGCATVAVRIPIVLLALLFVALSGGAAGAQPVPLRTAQPAEHAQDEKRATSALRFVAGALVGLGAHEAGHLAFDVAFDADPSMK